MHGTTPFTPPLEDDPAELTPHAAQGLFVALPLGVAVWALLGLAVYALVT